MNIPKNLRAHEIQYKLIAENKPFLALALYSEGFKSTIYKGPEKTGNPTFGIGINLASLSNQQRKEMFTEAGFSKEKINAINHSFDKGQLPSLKITLGEALDMAEWHRKNIAAPAAEKVFGKEYMQNLENTGQTMRKAAIEYLFFHYGEGGLAQMKNLNKKIREEDFYGLGNVITSNRRANYKGIDIYLPNIRSGILMEAAFRDSKDGKGFFLMTSGENGENAQKLEKLSNDYNNLAAKKVAELYAQHKLKPNSSNGILTATRDSEIFLNALISKENKELKEFMKKGNHEEVVEHIFENSDGKKTSDISVDFKLEDFKFYPEHSDRIEKEIEYNKKITI